MSTRRKGNFVKEVATLGDVALNIGLLAHVDAGKTTVTERFLCLSGQTRTAGSVDEGTTHTDFLSVERERGISVRSAVTALSWQGQDINLIDTPGHVDFAAEVERSLAVLDAAILIVSAAEGVQAQTELLWQALKATKTPTFFFLNKIDRPGVGTEQVMDEITRRFTPHILRLTTHTGEGGRDCNVALRRFSDPDFAEEVAAACGEFDEVLAEQYLLGETLSESELKQAIRTAVVEGNVCPVLCGSALADTGIDLLLTALTDYASPSGNDPEGADLSGIVFKIQQDKQMGKLSFVRLFGGELHNRDTVLLPGGEHKITQIRRCHADRFTDVGVAKRGDVAAVCGLSSAKVGDILGRKSEKLKEYALSVPLLKVRVLHSPDVSVATVLTAFRELAEEDPKLDVCYNEDEKEIDISITGTVQLEILMVLCKERYNLNVTFSPPTVIYKETPLSHGFGYDAYTMPKPCWAVIKFEIEPAPRGSGVTYKSIVPNGKILYRYQNHIAACLPDALKQGAYNWEVTDLNITLVDGGSHHIHTHPLDFFLCTPLALMDGLLHTGTGLMEPINRIRVVAPEEYAGRIIGDMVAMRGVYDSPVIADGRITLEADVPVAESLDYSVRLASATGGKARLSSRFLQYDLCPPGVGQPAKRRGPDPRDRAKWILYHRNAMRDSDK